MASKGADSPFLDSYFLFLMALTSHTISSDFHEELRREGVRVRDWRVLSCLIDRPSLMVTELARLTLYEQSHVTKIIDELEQDRLVKRLADPSDRRRTLVKITPSGVAVVRPLIEKARAHEEQVLSALTAAERRSIVRMLQKLAGKVAQ